MAPKRRMRSNTSLAVDTSSDDDTCALQVVQCPTKSPLALAPADQESDRSDGDDEKGAGDEIDSSDESPEKVPMKRMAVAKVPMKNVASAETSPLKRKAAKSPPRKKTGKAAAPASPPPLTRNALAAQLARSTSPEKAATAAASEATKPTPRKKAAVAATTEAANFPRPKKPAVKTEVAETPPPTGPADETMNVAPSLEAEAPAEEETLPQEGEYDAEKRFKEKSQTYWYLWQMAMTLEAEHFLSFKGAFLKIDDTKVSILNNKIKKLYVKEKKQQLGWKATEKGVTKVLVDLIQ